MDFFAVMLLLRLHDIASIYYLDEAPSEEIPNVEAVRISYSFLLDEALANLTLLSLQSYVSFCV